MMPKIILVGGGGHCISCIDVIEQEEKFQIAGIVDAKKIGSKILGYPVIGSDHDLSTLRKTYEYALVTIGQIKTPIFRVRLYEQLKSLGFNLPIIISPRSYVSKHAVIGDGTIIMHDVLINAQAEIGNNCIINTKALVEHHAMIASHCHISTGAIINGEVQVGQGTFIGSNAVVKQSAQIDENFFVRSGSLFVGSSHE
jgi:sugar O-acyltransferase (sialic acid O-acetyltransferase NeuD family)